MSNYTELWLGETTDEFMAIIYNIGAWVGLDFFFLSGRKGHRGTGLFTRKKTLLNDV